MMILWLSLMKVCTPSILTARGSISSGRTFFSVVQNNYVLKRTETFPTTEFSQIRIMFAVQTLSEKLNLDRAPLPKLLSPMHSSSSHLAQQKQGLNPINERAPNDFSEFGSNSIIWIQIRPLVGSEKRHQKAYNDFFFLFVF